MSYIPRRHRNETCIVCRFVTETFREGHDLNRKYGARFSQRWRWHFLWPESLTFFCLFSYSWQLSQLLHGRYVWQWNNHPCNGTSWHGLQVLTLSQLHCSRFSLLLVIHTARMSQELGYMQHCCQRPVLITPQLLSFARRRDSKLGEQARTCCQWSCVINASLFLGLHCLDCY
jgi:hypothetical protein